MAQEQKFIMDEEPTNKDSILCWLGFHNWCRCSKADGTYWRHCVRCGHGYEINRPKGDWSYVH